MTGTRSYENAKYLVRQGHAVTVLTGDAFLEGLTPVRTGKRYSEYEIDGIRVIAVRNRYSNYMSYMRRIGSFLRFMLDSSLLAIRQKRVDVVFATSTPLTVAVPALLMKLAKRVPYVFEVRDLWPEAPIQLGAIRSKLLAAMLRAFERMTYTHASHIVTLSPGMSEGVLRTGVRPDKITMVPNCSDLDLFGRPDAVSLRDRYGLEGKLVAVHGGSMGVANGLDYIVRAAVHLKREGVDDIAFLLTGDGKTKPELERMCREHGLDNVIFTGAIPRKEMPSVLKTADIAIVSFRNIPILATNSPNKLFDALAAGLPIIVNSAGWTKDIVENNRIGFYVDPEKPEELSRLLMALRSEKQRLAEMGKGARKLAEEQYDRMKLVRNIEEVLLAVRSETAKGTFKPGEALKDGQTLQAGGKR